MRLAPYRGEWLVLLLVALATAPILVVVNPQDVSRLGVSESIVERGEVDIEPYWRETTDRAFYAGRWYSDKAPGVALLAVPPVAALGARVWTHDLRLLFLRFWTGGLALLALTVLLGRTAEGLARGTGAVTAVTFALGTMAGSLGATTFGHLPDAAALFAAFLLATRRRWAAAGLLAGAGVLFEYPAGLAALVLVAYAWRSGGLWAGALTVAGGVPAALVLGAYDWIAFGSPFHLSYRYVSNTYTSDQATGFFGIGVPTARGAWFTLLDGHGLLVVSPVLVAAGAGLVLLARTHRREAIAAAAIAAVFVVTTMGYFLPNGGLSPGPRFATAALPFLLLGLPPALRRWPLPTLALAAISIGVGMFDELTWSVTNALRFAVWPRTLWSVAGLSPEAGGVLLLVPAGLVSLLALAAAVRGPSVSETKAA